LDDSQRCSEGNNIISNVSSADLDLYTNEALSLIRQDLWPSAARVNRSISVDLPLSRPPYLHRVPKQQLSILLDETDFFKHFSSHFLAYDPYAAGAYIPAEGKMYFNRGTFCVKTIIHETLHSCSITSVDDSLLIRFKGFFEGLTEFFAGYILQKMFSYSYEHCWRTVEKRNCQMTWFDATKLWGSFSYFVPLRITAELYFHTGSGNFNSKMDDLTRRIQDMGYIHFENPLDSQFSRFALVFSFARQCERNFGKEWDTIYRSDRLFSDYNNMRDRNMI
jgi:hypothetical protein